MRSARSSDGAARAGSQPVLTVAVVALLGLLGGAIHQARRAERANRDTAERALRDYASVAAWQFARRAGDALHDHITMATRRVMTSRERATRGVVLAPPSALLDPGSMSCSLMRQARYAFRIDLAPGEPRITVAGDPAVAGEPAHLLVRIPALVAGEGHEPHRLLADTIGGARRLIIAYVVRDVSGSARAIYGLDADTAVVRTILASVVGSHALLPPALTASASLPELLHVSVRTSDGALLYQNRAPFDATAARDSLSAEHGRLAVAASLDPSRASMLVIGGLPPSRVPALLAMFALGTLLAGVALVQARRERELARLRTRFVANVSHELRTPLAQISMFGETLMLGRERSVDERRQFASIIFREARRLTTLVEGVLRFSRAEAGQDALEPERRDVAADLHDAVAAFGPLAEAAGARLVVAVGSEPIVALADTGALRQVMLNLLDNAVKYGPEGQTVTATARNAGNEVLVSVADEGPGIAPADRERVFAPFTRLDRAGAPRVAGAGIGLAVVRELVLALGGRVWIDDAPGGGARVTFTLPRAAAEETSAGPTGRAADETATPGPVLTA